MQYNFFFKTIGSGGTGHYYISDFQLSGKGRQAEEGMAWIWKQGDKILICQFLSFQ